MNIFLDTSRAATENSTTSVTDTSNKALPSLFFGDILPLQVTVHNGQGSIDMNYQAAVITVALGILSTQNKLFVQTVTASNASADFILDLSGANFDTQTQGLESTTLTLEVQAIRDTGNLVQLPLSSYGIGSKIIILQNFNTAVTGEILEITDMVYNQTQNVTHPKFRQADGNEFFSQPAVTGFGRGAWWEVIDIAQNSLTIHQSTITLRNQILNQQNIVLELPDEPSNIVVEKLPTPAVPSNVLLDITPAVPSDVTPSQQTLPLEPSNVQSSQLLLPIVPSAVEIAVEPTQEEDLNRDPAIFNSSDIGRQIIALAFKPLQGLAQGETYIIASITNDGFAMNVSSQPGLENILFNRQGIHWNFVYDTDTNDIDTNDTEDNNNDSTNQAYYVYGNDGTRGVGYYYPVYLSDAGLTEGTFHNHLINGVYYSMENANANMGVQSLPLNFTLPIAPNTTDPAVIAAPSNIQINEAFINQQPTLSIDSWDGLNKHILFLSGVNAGKIVRTIGIDGQIISTIDENAETGSVSLNDRGTNWQFITFSTEAPTLFSHGFQVGDLVYLNRDINRNDITTPIGTYEITAIKPRNGVIIINNLPVSEGNMQYVSLVQKSAASLPPQNIFKFTLTATRNLPNNSPISGGGSSAINDFAVFEWSNTNLQLQNGQLVQGWVRLVERDQGDFIYIASDGSIEYVGTNYNGFYSFGLSSFPYIASTQTSGSFDPETTTNGATSGGNFTISNVEFITVPSAPTSVDTKNLV